MTDEKVTLFRYAKDPPTFAQKVARWFMQAGAVLAILAVAVLILWCIVTGLVAAFLRGF